MKILQSNNYLIFNKNKIISNKHLKNKSIIIIKQMINQLINNKLMKITKITILINKSNLFINKILILIIKMKIIKIIMKI